jgi:hypothetical protein
MGKGMRRFSWLALLLWLGCGEESGSADQQLAAAPQVAAPTPTTEATSVGAARDTKSSASSAMTTPTAAAPKPSGPGVAPGAGMASAPAAASGTPGSSASTGAPPPASGTSSGAAGAGAAPPSDGSAEGESDDEAGSPPPTSPVTGGTQASTLTAGTWDDNRNFERFEKYRKKLKDQQLPGMLPSTDEEHADAKDAFAQPAPREKLDVSLVIDTTGSMGDEIRYLQTEFLALSSAIEDKYPNAEQRWSLVAYRDMGDDYVTRVFDFSENVEEFRDKLSQQSAGGGGDFPEAPDAALVEMAKLSWRNEDKVARLAFLVADAPHHDKNAEDMLDAIRGAREIGVHLYPVASSGVDELTEVSLRSAAQLTGGRYLFLTDDSGVGGEHKEPTIPCYFVTKLDKAILRMVNIEISGVYAEPAKDDIIRTGGDPQSRSCTLESGEVVEAF